MKTVEVETLHFYFKRTFFYATCEDILPCNDIPYATNGEYNFAYYDSVYNAVDDQVMVALTGGFPEY